MDEDLADDKQMASKCVALQYFTLPLSTLMTPYYE